MLPIQHPNQIPLHWNWYKQKKLRGILLSSSSVYLIKYEDLMKNTLEELKKIYAFLDIEISSEEIHKIVATEA